MGKKRANGEGSIRKKANGRWEGRYTAGYDAVTGKLIQKSVSARTQAECREKMRCALRAVQHAPLNHTADYTVAEWCRLWLETYSTPNVRASTAEGYTNIIENHIIPRLGQMKLKNLSSVHVQRMYNELKVSGRVKRYEKMEDLSLSNRMVRGIHTILSGCLEQALKEQLITFNPCKNCKIPPKEKSEMVIIPPEKIGAYLAEAENYGLLPMFYTELTTGLRRGELLAIEWTDLDIDSSTLTVNKQVTRIRGELVVSEPKTKNSIRKIILPKQTVELLVGEHQRHPDSPLMFPSPRTGEYWSPDAIGRIHKRLLERAEIDEAVRFHDLRHTFATLAIQNGVDAKTVAGMLGHYSATFSLDTYTHITNTMQQNAAARIGAFMEKATTQCEWKEDT